MKALKHIALLFITLATLSACEDNNDIYEENWYHDDFEIRSNEWQLVGNPNEIYSYYECIYDGIPLRDSYYNGVVTAYMYFDFGTKYEVQTPLPYTEYIVEKDKNTGEEIRYSIQYSYDVKPDGTIAFKAYVSDYYTGLFNPGTQHFRVAIIW